MKNIICLFVVVACTLLGACTFHSKQPVNSEYYKKTQGITWPEEEPVKTDTPVFLDERT